MFMDKDEVVVSIRCLAYNHEPYIRQCLDGFVMQKTNFKVEVIVHDDASTDGTAAIIREYAEKYPELIKPIFETENQYSKHDGSLRRIMNEACIGKYIAMCEGDDYWTDPYKLQKQVDFLEKNLDYAFCCHRFEKYYEDSGSFDKEYAYAFYRNGYDLKITESLFFKVWVTQPLTALIRRDCLKRVYERKLNYKYFRDVHLFYFLLKEGKGISLNQFMGVYRLHKGGIAGMRDIFQSAKDTNLILSELWKNNKTDFCLLRYVLYIKIVYIVKYVHAVMFGLK